MTAQVPAVVASLPSTWEISLPSILPARYCAQKSTTIGAGAETFAAMASRHHWSCNQHDGRLTGRHRAHQLRRHRLVAAAHQNHSIHRLCPHHFLGVDRHQVAELETGRIEKNFTQRNGRKFNRQRASGQHAALHGLEHFREVTMAIIET